jgi:drug/metabolite transporter (DMT)-like permease
MKEKVELKKGLLFILLSTFLFSSMEISLKVVTGIFNPVQITFLRFLIGSIILLPLTIKGLRARKVILKGDDFSFFAKTGFLCVVVSMILFQMAVVYGQASVVAVLFSCNPVFVVIFAYFILKEPITKYTVMTLMFSLAGILAIMNPANMAGNGLAIVLILLSALTFALYGVIGRKRSERYGGFGLTCLSFLFGSAEMLVLIFLSRVGFIADFLTASGLSIFARVPLFQGITLASLPMLLYIGVFISGFGYAFYFLAMEETSAATASLVFFIKPVLAPIMAYILINDPITINMVAGIVLIVAGSVISFIPKLRPAQQESLETELEEVVDDLEEDVENDIAFAEGEVEPELAAAKK